MTGSIGGWSRGVATRGIIAAVPAAMVMAYSGNLVAPTTPRSASYSYVETAEIVDSPSTVGIADSNLYGMTDAEISTELDRLQSLGVTNIRVFVPWGLVEYADDTYDWSYVDGIMKAAEERDMGVMMEVNATPSWAVADSESSNVPAGSATPDVAKSTDFMATLATRYGDTVSAYEIWNEPNYVSFSNPIDPAAYAQLLKSVYPVLKDIDPTATVVAGALGTVQDSAVTMSAVTFVQQMLDAGAGDYFDAISVHPYQDTLPISDGYSCNCGGQLTPVQEIDAIKVLIGTDKTVWITEYGLSTVNGDEDEAKQAQYIQDLLDYWQTYSQAGPIFLYTGSDTATGSSDPEANYGLFYENGDLKQAAEMLAAWIAEHTTVTTPTDPGSTTQPTLQEAIQSIVNAVSETIRSAVQSVSVFAQAIVTAITNVVTNVTNALASIGGVDRVAAAADVTESAEPAASQTRAVSASSATDASPTTRSAGSATSPSVKAAAQTTTAEGTGATTVTSSHEEAEAVTDSSARSTSAAPADTTPASAAATSAPAGAETSADPDNTSKTPKHGADSETGATGTDESPNQAASEPNADGTRVDRPARRRGPTHTPGQTPAEQIGTKTGQGRHLDPSTKERHLAGLTSSSDGAAAGGDD